MSDIPKPGLFFLGFLGKWKFRMAHTSYLDCQGQLICYNLFNAHIF